MHKCYVAEREGGGGGNITFSFDLSTFSLVSYDEVQYLAKYNGGDSNQGWNICICRSEVVGEVAGEGSVKLFFGEEFVTIPTYVFKPDLVDID